MKRTLIATAVVSTLTMTAPALATPGASHANSNSDQTQSQAQSQDQDIYNKVDVDAAGTTNVDARNIHREKKRPVHTAYSAPLTSSNDTCMGSSSAGVQGVAFGITIGSTWKDNDCIIRKDSKLLYNMQRSGVALALMCQKESIRRAVEMAGSFQDKVDCGLIDPADLEDTAPTYDGEGG